MPHEPWCDLAEQTRSEQRTSARHSPGRTDTYSHARRHTPVTGRHRLSACFRVRDEVVGPGLFGRPQGHLTGRARTGGEVAFGQEAAGDVTLKHAVPPGVAAHAVERGCHGQLPVLGEDALACSMITRLLSAVRGCSVTISSGWMARSCRMPMVATSARTWPRRRSASGTRTAFGFCRTTFSDAGTSRPRPASLMCEEARVRDRRSVWGCRRLAVSRRRRTRHLQSKGLRLALRA